MRHLLAPILLSLALCSCDSSNPSTAAPPTQPTPVELHEPVAAGDSITENWAGENPAVPISTTIYDLIPGVIDEGVSGNTCEAVLDRFPAILSLKPVYIVLLCGTNNVLSGLTDTSAITTMVIDAQAAGVPIFLCTLPPSPLLDQGAIDAWNTAVAAIASAYGLTLIDYHAAMLAGGAALFGSDREHPNAEGYAVMWPVLHAALEQL